MVETITVTEARRLALIRAGLLKPEWTAIPRRATGRGARARRAAHRVIGRFGYLQLDSVSVSGARSHVLVLLSRINGFDPLLGEALLQPGEPLFEFWGHEASWIPMPLYPAFHFRRREFRLHPWYGDVLGEHAELAAELLERIGREGPLRSVDMESGGGGWWQMRPIKKVALALWSCGELAIRERRRFLRTFDLAENVIPGALRCRPLARPEAVQTLIDRALAGHGWATTATVAATWRLKSAEVGQALLHMEEGGAVQRCALAGDDGRVVAGWIRPADMELAGRMGALRPRRDRGVLLSPFDPILWDRGRVRRLFAFEQVLEIYKPAAERRYGYYCLPVLAGDRMVARVDLKCDRHNDELRVLSCHYEASGRTPGRDREAVRAAVARLAVALSVAVVGVEG